jgi:hypothetical protein
VGHVKERKTQDGKVRYTACYLDLRGRERSAGTFSKRKDAERAATAAFASARDSAGKIPDVQLREALLARVAATEAAYREAAAPARALIASVQCGLASVAACRVEGCGRPCRGSEPWQDDV